MLQLNGFHHLTAVTADVQANHAFYTQTLGLRLVKKTVNQDDTSAYHLFFADGKASPGTDITFFDWPLPRERRGTHSIARTGFRIAGGSALEYWAKRFKDLGVTHTPAVERDGRQVIEFEDPEGQRLALVTEEATQAANPWERSPVPAEHQIRGLGPITISVPETAGTDAVLTQVMNMKQVRQYTMPPTDGRGSGWSTVLVYQTGGGAAGPASELHVAVEAGLSVATSGAGGVHHVAFRVPTYEEYDQWAQRLRQFRVPNSGPVDRFYFRSLYFREPNGILFELATDGPGFAADEAMETLGEKLSLPPFLEGQRKQIEARLKPLT